MVRTFGSLVRLEEPFTRTRLIGFRSCGINSHLDTPRPTHASQSYVVSGAHSRTGTSCAQTLNSPLCLSLKGGVPSVIPFASSSPVHLHRNTNVQNGNALALYPRAPCA